MEQSEQPNAAVATSNQYHNLYKYNGLTDNQQKRRQDQLERLKKRRKDELDKLRRIDEIFEDVDESEEEPVDALEYRHKKRTHYGSKLMLSEWMSELPLDLEEMWLFKICPIGVRNIVIAHKGVTKVYNRRNQMKGIFSSNLPGGNQSGKQSAFTIIDCIYRNKTYYVLDVLIWNSHSLFKCSTEFRFFFLRSKLLESPELQCPSNKFKFIHVDYHTALLPNIESQFCEENHMIDNVVVPVDGILFYHKDCIYISGHTPLVGWLKPYMIPEQLQVPVHQSYMNKAPKMYTTLMEYLQNIWAKSKKRTKDLLTSMETDIDTTETEDSMELDDLKQ